MDTTSLTSGETITILLLGETGAGKSTWINGIINYLTHTTLQEAENAEELITLVASSFIITDSQMEIKQITVPTKYGRNDNEADVSKGDSATKRPVIYCFAYGKKNIRLIDTPGIGDTRGVFKDEKNFEEILKCLRTVNEIHGICILLKPNDSRLTLLFRFCLSELLTHLHHDAARNIVFCFTNTRATNYRPGETYRPLTTMLEEFNKKENVNIQLNTKTIYCFDNEAFKLLCAAKQGIKFDKRERQSFTESWDTSRTETIRLFDYFGTIRPHNSAVTICLNDARNVVLSLAEPMAELVKIKAINAEIVNQKILEIKKIDEHDSEMEKKINITILELVSVELNYPMTVCTIPKCTETVEIEDVILGMGPVAVTIYRTECHPHCYLKGVPPDTISASVLRHCSAMNTLGICNNCGCEWNSHMHRTHRIDKICKKITSPTLQDLLANGASQKHILEAALVVCEELIRKMKANQIRINEISAIFCAFLQRRALVVYNDAYGDYVDFQIREERNKVASGTTDMNLKILENMKATYKNQVEMLKTKSPDMINSLTPENIYELRDELYSMEDGGFIMKSLDIISKGRQSVWEKQIVVYPPSSDRMKFRLENSHNLRRQSRHKLFNWIKSK